MKKYFGILISTLLVLTLITNVIALENYDIITEKGTADNTIELSTEEPEIVVESAEPTSNANETQELEIEKDIIESATPQPTEEPIEELTIDLTEQPSLEPTLEPTTEPSVEPTVDPTIEPTVEPTPEPTAEPTAEPTPPPVRDDAETAAIIEEDMVEQATLDSFYESEFNVQNNQYFKELLTKLFKTYENTDDYYMQVYYYAYYMSIYKPADLELAKIRELIDIDLDVRAAFNTYIFWLDTNRDLSFMNDLYAFRNANMKDEIWLEYGFNKLTGAKALTMDEINQYKLDGFTTTDIKSANILSRKEKNSTDAILQKKRSGKNWSQIAQEEYYDSDQIQRTDEYYLDNTDSVDVVESVKMAKVQNTTVATQLAARVNGEKIANDTTVGLLDYLVEINIVEYTPELDALEANIDSLDNSRIYYTTTSSNLDIIEDANFELVLSQYSQDIKPAYSKDTDKNVDNLTGGVSIKETDLALPGKAGLDYNIGRRYSSDTLTTVYSEHVKAANGGFNQEFVLREYEMNNNKYWIAFPIGSAPLSSFTAYTSITDVTHDYYNQNNLSFTFYYYSELIEDNGGSYVFSCSSGTEHLLHDLYEPHKYDTFMSIGTSWMLDIPHIKMSKSFSYTVDESIHYDVYGYYNGVFYDGNQTVSFNIENMSVANYDYEDVYAFGDFELTSRNKTYENYEYSFEDMRVIKGGDNISTSALAMSKEPYNDTAKGISYNMVLTRSDGRKYYMLVRNNEFEDTYYTTYLDSEYSSFVIAFPTMIEDKYGNTIRFNYDSNDVLTSVVDSMGRTIEYYKDNGGTNESVQILVKDGDDVTKRVVYTCYQPNSSTPTGNDQTLTVDCYEDASEDYYEENITQTVYTMSMYRPVNTSTSGNSFRYLVEEIRYPNHDTLHYEYAPDSSTYEPMVTASYYKMDGVVKLKDTYTYNRNYASIIEEYTTTITHVSNGGKTINIGDEAGRLHKSTVYDSDNKIRQEITLTYDGTITIGNNVYITVTDGVLTEELKVYNEDNQSQYRTVTTNNVYGGMNNRKTSSSNGLSTNVYSYGSDTSSFESATNPYGIVLEEITNGSDGTALRTVNTLTEDKKSIAQTEVYDNNVLKSKTAYTYNADGTLASKKEYMNSGQYVITTYSYTYSSNGGYTKTSTIGASIGETFVYDEVGDLVSYTDGEGNVTTYEYDDVGRLTKVIDPDNNITSYLYSTIANTVTVTDAKGGQVRYTYALNGEVEKLEVKSANSWHTLSTVAFDNMLRKSSVHEYRDGLDASDQSGHFEYRYEYDDSGNLIKQTAYNNDGTCIYTREISYEEAATVDGASDYTKVKIHLTGDATITPADVVYTYDKYGRMIEMKQLNPVDNSVYYYEEYENDIFGNPVKVKTTQSDAQGLDYQNLFTYELGNANRVTSTTNALGKSAYKTYNYLGQVTSESDFKGGVVNYTYDTLGRLYQVTYPHAENATTYGQETYYYDYNGNVTEQWTRADVNSEGEYTHNITVNTYDSLNRLTKTEMFENRGTDNYEDSNGKQTVVYTYDAVGNLLTSSVKNYDETQSKTYTYTYNELNQCISVTDALGQTVTNTYNLAGQPKLTTDRNGVTASTNYGMDLIGNPVCVTYYESSDPSASYGEFMYEYDILGNVTKITSTIYGTDVIHYTYDSFNRLTSETNDNIIKLYEYDCIGNRTKLTVKENNQINYVVDYTYDVLGRLTSVSDNKNGEATYTYDDNGNLISKNVCGIVSEYLYDEKNAVTQTKTSWEDNWIKTNLTYDLMGNVTDEVTRNSQYSLSETGSPIYEKEFTYNGLNQLVMEDFTYKPGTSGQYSDVMQYVYDYAGNRILDDVERIATQAADQRDYIANTYTYDNNNRLVSKTDIDNNTTSYTYDKNGNEVMSVQRNSENEIIAKKVLAYDILNRLEYYGDEYMYEQTNMDYYARYTYYADGMRKSKNVGGINTQFVWDGGTLVGEMYDEEAYSQEFTKAADTETLAIKANRTESVGELSVDIYAKAGTISQTLAGTVLIHEDAWIDDEDGWAIVDISSLPAGDYVFKMSGYGTGVFVHRAMADNGAHCGTDIVEGTFSYKLISTSDVETGPAVTQTETDYVPMSHNGDLLDKTYMTGLGTELSSSASLDGIYYLTNWRGDVNIVLDNEQDIRASYIYNAFGTEREEALMTPISTSSAVYDTNPVRYAGQYYDSESGNYYLRARYYSPYTGRFTQEDTYWNLGNMIYGDEQKVKHIITVDSDDKINDLESLFNDDSVVITGIDSINSLSLKVRENYTVTNFLKQNNETIYSVYDVIRLPNYMAISQSTNLYAYAVNNPVKHVDYNGNFVAVASGTAVGLIIVAAAAVVVTGAKYLAAEHRKLNGSPKRTNDKHTKPRPGRANEKKKMKPDWKPRK